MAGQKVAGVDVLLKIKDTANDGSLITVGGQTSATLNREAETIDTTDKDTGGFTTAMAGNITWSIDAEGFVVLSDNALNLIEDAFLNREKVEAEIRVGATDSSDGITYTGSGYIVDMPLEFAQDSAVTYSISISGATALEKTKGSESSTA